MNVLLVLGHPDADSFNHAIARTAAEALTSAGHLVVFHDLYAEEFDPLMPSGELGLGDVDPLIETHCRQLADADGIVVVHPSWWGQPPAMVKGWIDRVFRPGIAYRFDSAPSGEGIPVGLLRATRALVFNTANTDPRRDWGALGDPLEEMWNNAVLGFCGVDEVRRALFAPVLISTPEQRGAWLEDVRRLVAETFVPAEASVR